MRNERRAVDGNGNRKGARHGRGSTGGYTRDDDDLYAGADDRVRSHSVAKLAFDKARDPLSNCQIEDIDKSETGRREESGGGSQMVKRHRPFPELKPSFALAQYAIREAFNRAWLREQRAARLARMRQVRAVRAATERKQEMPRFPKGPTPKL